MGQQIIKQPNGKFAIFSSYTDTIILWDATAGEIIDYFVNQAAADARRTVKRLLGYVQTGNAREAHYQFSLTWDEALELDRDHGGDVWKDPSWAR